MHEKKECTYPYQSFIDLAELNVFPLEFALLIAPSAELSNRLMFDYEEIDDKLVYHSVSSHLEHYLKYMYYINQYLKRT
jgi:uncharacterized protein YutE (UPF0331/DUF86 family)